MKLQKTLLQMTSSIIKLISLNHEPDEFGNLIEALVVNYAKKIQEMVRKGEI